MQKSAPKENGTGMYDQSDCMFCPGERVILSGIYEICHHDEPRVKALLVRNTIFPLCKRCADQVRYKLVRPAPHISEDADFIEGGPGADLPPTTGASLSTHPVQLGFDHGFRYSQEYLQNGREDS